MKRTLINIAILSTILGTGMAQAGGWDRSGQDTSIILKEGNLLEVSSVSVAPKITGTYLGTNVATGKVAPDYSFTNIAFRSQINDDVSIALIQDEPFGAAVDWTDSSGAYSPVEATIKSSATTVLMGYDFDNITVYGGLKNQSFQAEATTPIVGASPAYNITSTADSSLGYVLGAAFERPEIALKLALTFSSKVSHQVPISEKLTAGSAPVASILQADTPSSINFDFQTGIAADTLLFGSVRSVKWTQTDLRPNVYVGAHASEASLKKFTTDPITYNLGVARKFSDKWAGAFTYGTEASEGGTSGPLGPTDGFSKMGVAVSYSADKADITLAMQKVNNGDTTMTYASMADNTTTVTVVKVAYKF